MKFFKKRKINLEPSEKLSVDDVQPGTRRIITRWSDEEAKYIYVLQRYVLDEGIFIYTGTANYVWTDITSGDEEWAKRISQHYGIQFDSSLGKEEDATN